ncbi:hypothetical protein BFW38_03665 [Terasakiispira papahanaumokuakeensis]|uniref:Uncharacterized protein n=1 Tax=Terasakiispira papahanaumokuakeensis TaxID=197479 RepID=A0A1E2V721_9GAMM|nr:hypothetical protein [Terasakiispira papahanaumokuakeensis]ODC02774.1 hypothetical protein BFW38_03665 [Terasakiispira papahanaumokuakeensis]
MALFKSQKENNNSFFHDNDDVVIFTPYEGQLDLSRDLDQIDGIEITDTTPLPKAVADDANDAVIFSSSDDGGLDDIDLSDYEPMEDVELPDVAELPHIEASFFKTLEGDYSDLYDTDIPYIGGLEETESMPLPKAVADDANDAVIFSSSDDGGLDDIDLSDYEPMEDVELPDLTEVSFIKTLEGDYSDWYNSDIPNIGDLELIGTTPLPETGDLLA